MKMWKLIVALILVIAAMYIIPRRGKSTDKGKYDQAISDYTKAIEIDPGHSTAYNNRGVAYGEKGQYDRAISDYTKAIEINPRFAAAYYNRGLAYQNKGGYDQAIPDYNKALEINPRLAEAYHAFIARFGVVMLKLKFENAQGGIFQFIPPKAELRPVRRRRICDIGD